MRLIGRPLGLSARLALIVAAGFAVLQAIMVTLILTQSAGQDRGPGYPIAARLAAIVAVIETAAPNERALVLRALNGREARFRLSDTPEIAGFEAVAPGWRMRWAAEPDANLDGRTIRMLAPSGQSENVGTGRGRRLIVLGLTTGDYLVIEPAQTGRRWLTPLAIIIANAVLGVIVVIAVWTLTKRLAGPLETIAERAESFASDLTAPPMAVDVGPPEARRMAEAFNRLRADVQVLMTDRLRMLAAVAHDLKTYLTRLQMRTGLIEDPTHRNAADHDIQHMATLIEDVILAARGDERPVELTSFDLGRLIAEIIGAREDGGGGIESAGVRTDLWAVGNAASIRRALDNLIDNALTYGTDVKIVVTREQGSWGIAVIDHGPGLPPGFDQVALEPFTRAEPSRNRETGGSGLGLFIASTLVRQSGGDLYLSETLGGGLTAKMVIPSDRR